VFTDSKSFRIVQIPLDLADDALVVPESDKVTIDVPSPAAGVI